MDQTFGSHTYLLLLHLHNTHNLETHTTGQRHIFFSFVMISFYVKTTNHINILLLKIRCWKYVIIQKCLFHFLPLASLLVAGTKGLVLVCNKKTGNNKILITIINNKQAIRKQAIAVFCSTTKIIIREFCKNITAVAVWPSGQV